MPPLPHEIISRLAPWGLEVVSLVAEFHLSVRWDVGCVVVSGFYGGHAESVACGLTGRASALQRAVLMAAYMQVVGAEEGGRA